MDRRGEEREEGGRRAKGRVGVGARMGGVHRGVVGRGAVQNRRAGRGGVHRRVARKVRNRRVGTGGGRRAGGVGATSRLCEIQEGGAGVKTAQVIHTHTGSRHVRLHTHTHTHQTGRVTVHIGVGKGLTRVGAACRLMRNTGGGAGVKTTQATDGVYTQSTRAHMTGWRG